jgi:hypothetical protein
VTRSAERKRLTRARKQQVAAGPNHLFERALSHDRACFGAQESTRFELAVIGAAGRGVDLLAGCFGLLLQPSSERVG